jgi:PST family polysaccharide transporter
MVGILVYPTSGLLVVIAPELIHAILGDGWDRVVVPFQVLCFVLPVSTTYTISDSLARATGVVYKRAWRQFVFAGAVMLGSWYGQRWGLSGVAIGAGLATVLNQILMLQLSRTVTSLGWGELIKSHLGAVPAFLLAAGFAYATLAVLRPLALPDVITIGASILVVGIGLLPFLRFTPRLLVGSDGMLALVAILDFVEEKFPTVLTNRLLRWILPIEEMAGIVRP